MDPLGGATSTLPNKRLRNLGEDFKIFDFYALKLNTMIFSSLVTMTIMYSRLAASVGDAAAPHIK